MEGWGKEHLYAGQRPHNRAHDSSSGKRDLLTPIYTGLVEKYFLPRLTQSSSIGYTNALFWGNVLSSLKNMLPVNQM